MLKTDTYRFRLAGSLSDVLPRLFRSESGHLLFGFAGRTLKPATLEDITSEEVVFSEMLFEAVTRYGLTVSQSDDGVELNLRLQGTSRDKDVPGWIEHWLRKAGALAEN